MAMTGGIGYEIDQLAELGVPELMRRQSVDPQLKYALALQEATKMVEAAARERDMAQQMPMPADVVGQMETSLAKRLAPGVQQQGQRSTQMQNRAAMGLPGQAAPNLARMAQGGIVGYQEGGDVEGKSMQVPTTINENQRRAPYLDPALEKFLIELEALNAQKDAAFPQEKDLFQQKIQDLISTTSPRVLRIASDSAFGLPKKSGMAMGGVVKYQEGGDIDIDALLDALMMAESGGDPRAVSEVGAEGAYQIMPATAADPGFGVRPMEGSRFDPEESRKFAGDYLQAMLDRYEGDMEAALVAYNAGPTNADKFVAAGKDYDVLPQAMQTQPYVSRVLGSVEKEDEPILDIGAGIENIKEGIARLFRPSRATAEARRIERGQMERQGQEAAQRGERVVEALNVPRLTPEQIANVGAAADVEVLPQAAERLPERTAAETQRRERVVRREAAGIPTVAPTNVTVPTRAEAFGEMFPGAQSAAERFKIQKQLGAEQYPEAAPLKKSKKGIAGLLDKIGGTQGLLNVAETLGRGAGASKGFEAAKIVEESARARAAQQARQDQLDKLREQLEVEREKISATKATAEAKALADLSKEQREAVGEFLSLPATQTRMLEIQEELGVESVYDPRVLEMIQPEISAFLSARGMTGSVGGMGGLGTQPGISEADQALIDQYSPST